VAAGLDATSLQHWGSQPCSIMRMRRKAGIAATSMTPHPTGNPLPGGTSSQSPSRWHQLLCGSPGALWSLVASPTHGQRGHLNRQSPCPETGLDGISSKTRLSYLPYVTIGNWFWQGTCRVRTQVLGEDACALSPPPRVPSSAGTAVPSKGCTWPTLTQHRPGPEFVNPPLATACGTGGCCRAHPHGDSHDLESSETPPSSRGPP